MSNYSFSDEAVKDLNSICEYIAQNNPKAASKLFDAIRQKCKLVSGFPNMGKSYERLSPNLRGFSIEDYIVLYYPREDGIDIARVISGYRDLESMFLEPE
ncbi:type II toxin-antitoxin system RelE/ParE family toxin [Brasilonema octagenarum UFV-E1]|jgi:toxin ParE1/3/4|uniref:Type II toxin-antitoxin system RelE/ParE family toxin n=1 Tax=Brasilonema sennae CENA114 TaxID=415709 RepID=A0A856MC62_9CYAN|nr:type II toxin-antitoxin system RelE/ParE family toxin [Brasilonema sennae]QDL07944.1 type II toxin-antitoxin system RelE/ParE family toxin [Brasilonema sennae CENA114]QDL14304.1 type II toxin-antitoxin system RelE/ParE family toxin [Brasilonema octagenarum UFV-E1]